MSIRTYRVVTLAQSDLPSVDQVVEYSSKDGAIEFDAPIENLCPDCSTPYIDVTEPVAGECKLIRKWHDSVCPIAPAAAQWGVAHHRV